MAKLFIFVMVCSSIVIVWTALGMLLDHRREKRRLNTFNYVDELVRSEQPPALQEDGKY